MSPPAVNLAICEQKAPSAKLSYSSDKWITNLQIPEEEQPQKLELSEHNRQNKHPPKVAMLSTDISSNNKNNHNHNHNKGGKNQQQHATSKKPKWITPQNCHNRNKSQEI